MTTQTATLVKSDSRFGAALLAGFVGVAMIFMAGIAQSETLHNAAHDLRHATGFPCH